ncbi:MAG: hypothetical protein JWP89_1500 [Schlesneria sp.]|nr:hypothetical protein [Schlesneria sp.]
MQFSIELAPRAVSTFQSTRHNLWMNQQPVTINRTLVGSLALVLLIAAAVLVLTGADGSQGMWAGACLKVGLVMGAFWLALPSITRHEVLGRMTWGTLIVAIALALAVGRTKVPLKVVLPVAAAFFFMIRILGPRRAPPRA